MRSVLMKITLFSLLFQSLPSEVAAKKEPKTLLPASENGINTVIFDLGDVLFTTSKSTQTMKILSLMLKHPSLMYNMWGMDVKKELFTMLKQVPAQSCPEQNPMYNGGEKMPQIMADWMTCRSDQEVCETALAHIQTTNYPEATKQLFSSIIQFMFCPEQLIAAQVPIEPMVKLVSLLKERGYKLYVLSNWSKNSAQLLQERHQELFKKFDGIMISGDEGIGKPHPEFYQRLLKKYNLQASQCAFIDDEPYNVQAARELGIHGVLNDSMHSVHTQLEQAGIIVK